MKNFVRRTSYHFVVVSHVCCNALCIIYNKNHELIVFCTVNCNGKIYEVKLAVNENI